MALGEDSGIVAAWQTRMGTSASVNATARDLGSDTNWTAHTAARMDGTPNGYESAHACGRLDWSASDENENEKDNAGIAGVRELEALSQSTENSGGDEYLPKRTTMCLPVDMSRCWPCNNWAHKAH